MFQTTRTRQKEHGTLWWRLLRQLVKRYNTEHLIAGQVICQISTRSETTEEKQRNIEQIQIGSNAILGTRKSFPLYLPFGVRSVKGLAQWSKLNCMGREMKCSLQQAVIKKAKTKNMLLLLNISMAPLAPLQLCYVLYYGKNQFQSSGIRVLDPSIVLTEALSLGDLLRVLSSRIIGLEEVAIRFGDLPGDSLLRFTPAIRPAIYLFRFNFFVHLCCSRSMEPVRPRIGNTVCNIFMSKCALRTAAHKHSLYKHTSGN